MITVSNQINADLVCINDFFQKHKKLTDTKLLTMSSKMIYPQEDTNIWIYYPQKEQTCTKKAFILKLFRFGQSELVFGY